MASQNFHYLGKKGFPHADGVSVYKYENDFDYSRFNYSQMSIQMCNVNWDQGEAHEGQKVLSGIGNVVYFENKDARDEWFDAIPDTECFRWETKYKDLHTDLTLNVPLPFDVASKYNYIRVKYNLFANDDSPIEGETDDGMREWFYFIRRAEFVAPNTSRLTLLDDAWQTWIYDLRITNMILERGHAPMFETQTDKYLQDPIDNAANLLTEDVNFGELQRVTKSQVTTLNAYDVYAMFAVTSAPWGNWDDNVPVQPHSDFEGVPNRTLFAIDASNLNSFLDSCVANAPQFLESVECVFFVEKDLIRVGDSFTFGGVECRFINGSAQVSKEIFSRSKSDWGYAPEYENLAKLYTYPYSILEITDQEGNTEQVRIEDTSNVLTMDIACNLVFPALNLSGVIHGIGGHGQQSVAFNNMWQHSLNISGRWYEHLKEWKIPTFSVVLSNSRYYDYSSRFDRMQANNDRETERNISYRSAATARDNGNASANANASNERNNAGNVIANGAAQTAANSSITASANAASSTDAGLANALAQAIQAWDAGITRETTNNEVNKENQTASIGAAGGVASSVVGGAVSGLSGGSVMGAVANAIGGMVTGGIDAAVSLATNDVTVSATEAQAEAVISNSQSKLNETQRSNVDRTNNANSSKSSQTSATNTMISTSANNTASTMTENANRSESTSVGNNNRQYDTSITNADARFKNEGDRIANHIAQANLGKPHVFGATNDADFATTRPMALFVNIVTESSNAIMRAGDEFLRYGYNFDRQWRFDGNWNIGKHFTFWKLRDYWSSSQLPDVFGDQIRFLLFGGVTVWRKPEDIGRVSIYDNGI